jgi:hypothetical protein
MTVRRAEGPTARRSAAAVRGIRRAVDATASLRLLGGRLAQARFAAAAAPLLLFFCLAGIVDWPWLSGRMTIPWDAEAAFEPQIEFLARSLHQGQSPFWTPFAFSGHPQIADPQAMIFSPYLALAALTGAPSLWAVDATELAIVALAGAALILWFRDRGWHPAGALIAALAFSFGASMAWRIQHIGQVLSLAYLPMALLCLDRALARRSLAYGLALGCIVALIVLGRDQVALLVLYLIAAFLLWRVACAPRRLLLLRQAAAPLLAAAAVGASIAAIPVLLTVLFVAVSNRPFIDYVGAARGSLHPALLLTLVMPDLFGSAGRMEDYWGPPSFAWPDTGLFVAQNMGVLYVGIIPLFVAFQAALRRQLWAPEIRFFSCALIATLFYALGWYTPFFRTAYTLMPGVSLYRRPADATFLIGALLAILSGYATHRLFCSPRVAIRATAALAAAAALSLCVLAALGLGWAMAHTQRLALPLASVACWCGAGALALAAAMRLTPGRPQWAAAILACTGAADLAANNGPNSATALPPSVYDVLRPASDNALIAALKRRIVADDRRRDRIELAGLGFHWPSASLVHGLENTLGYNPLRLALYSRATGAGDNAGLPEERTFSPLFPSYSSILANLLGLRFIATGVPIASIDARQRGHELPLVERTARAFIYENANAFDRVLFARAAREADFDRLLADGAWPDADLAATVLLAKGSAPLARRERRPGRARILSYANAKVVIAADSPDGGWVVLNDLWHPWWFADVDGTPAPVLRANVLFRALAVPPGHHILRFRFRPVAGALRELMGRWRGELAPRQEPGAASASGN